MDKENFERIAKLLNVKCPIPTDKDIEDTISMIREKLQKKEINRFVNAPIKEGYTMSVEILSNRQQGYLGIEKLKTNQGRAIAMIAVDYLTGDCSQQVLCGIPLRK